MPVVILYSLMSSISIRIRAACLRKEE
jgi:hypothetical protein